MSVKNSMSNFYSALAKYYDLLYAHKDYKSEAENIRQVIEKHKISKGNALLEVACGTGKHIEYLKEYYTVTGLDLSEDMLAVARKNISGVEFIQSDMTQMSLGKQFDVITCLFGSVNYIQTREGLSKTFKAFSDHLNKGGIVVFEPMFTEENLYLGNLGFTYVDGDDVKLARMNLVRREGDLVLLDFHFLVGTSEGINYYKDPSPMSVFSHDTLVTIMEDNGFHVEHEKAESMKSAGLFIGIKQ